MKRANFLSVLIIGFFMIVVWPVGAQTAPVGYFQHGDWYCNSDTNFEKPGNVLGQKFCQPQITGCQAAGGKFCTAGTRNVCCQADSTCGKGTALGLFEVAVCVPPTATTCGPKSPGYAGTTKEGKNICCRAGQEPGPAGGTKAPYCQPASRSACAPGERFIQGAGTFQNEKRCCSANTIPSYHPIGLPFCARLPFTVLAPNGGEQISGLNNRGYYQVRWTTTDIPPDKQIKLSLIDSRASVVFQYMFPNTGSAGLYFSTFPNGQYKIELSVTMDGKTIVDQSDNFFTLTGSNPSPPPPATSGDTTPPTISLSAPLLLSSGTQLTLYATDPSGLTSSSIAVLSPQATIPLFKTCNYNNNRPTLYSCTLAVSKSQWVLGTIVFISAVDYSPNKNVNFESYELVSSGQLRKQDTSGSKIIIPPLTMWCHTFNANLSIGMNGSEVAALQTALTRAGFTVSATGNYGEATAAAVSGFQLKYQSEILTPLGLANPTGYFGPATRQKMNQLYGCGNAAVVPSVPPVTPSVTPSLTVISPAANSSWTSSNGPVIQWSSANIPSGNQIMVELLTPAGAAVSGFSNFTTANDGNESGRLSNSTIPSGWYYFRLSTIVSGQTVYGGSGVFQFSQSVVQPTLRGFRARVMDRATGDGLAGAAVRIERGGTYVASPTTGSDGYIAAIPLQVGATHTFTFSKAGYRPYSPIIFTIPAGSGTYTYGAIWLDPETTTVPSPATPSISVSSPINNSSWTSSNGPVIQWSSANIPSGNQIMVELLTPAGAAVSGFSNFTTANDGNESGRLSNSTIPSGWYYFRLSTIVSGQTVYGGSGVFQFSQPAAAASITVSSPSTNSSWSPTNSPVVSWTTAGVPDSNNVLIELLTPTNGSVSGFASRTVRNDQRPLFNALTGSTIPSGWYYFRLSTIVSGQTVYGGSGVFQFSQPAAAASITVSSPAIGENWLAGSTQTVRWTSTGISDLYQNYIQILDTNDSPVSGFFGAVGEDWRGQKEVTVSATLPTGFYKIRVVVVYNNSNSMVIGVSSQFQITR